MDKNKLAIVVLTLVVIALAIYTLGIPRAQVVTEVVKEVQKVGALAEIPSPYFTVNGVRTWHADIDMRAATTSICSIQGPAATTSINFVSWRIDTGTSTAATIDIGTSTTAFATTTNLVPATSVASGAKGSQVWRPVGGSVRDHILAPNEYVNVKTAGAGLGGYTYGGQCTAVLQEV